MAAVTGIQIRQRRAADLRACVDILADVHEHDGYPMYWPADPAAWLSPSDTLKTWVAVTGDERIAGHVMLRATSDDGVVSLSRLFVAPKGRGHGAARALLGQAMRWAGEQGARLVLEVSSERGHAAMALYEAAGWHRTHSAQASWNRPDGHPVIAHHYTWRA